MSDTTDPKDGNQNAADAAVNVQKKDSTPAPDLQTVSPAEFEKIPLEFIIATPLLTAIQAHKQAAMTTLAFINEIKDSTTEFSVNVKEIDATGKETSVIKKISVPLISLVKVPSLNFDSMSVSFSYSIQQVHKSTADTSKQGQAGIQTSGILSKFLGASFSGSLEKKTSDEMTSNRSGNLEIKINISESPMPAGLQKIIDAMVAGINNPQAAPTTTGV